MIWLVTFFVRRGLSERVAKPLAIATALTAAALLLWALWATWLHFHDKGVIEWHEEQITKQVDAATDAANATANANDAVRQSENARADEQLRGAITDAQTEHPDETRRPAGPAVSGTLDRLRDRQAKAGASVR